MYMLNVIFLFLDSWIT